MKLFYDQLTVGLDDVYAKIERLEIDSGEKKKLAKLIDQTTHHTVLDTILKHLDSNHHQTFLSIFHRAPHHSNNAKFLKAHVKDIDAKIKQAIKKLKSSLLAEFNS